MKTVIPKTKTKPQNTQPITPSPYNPQNPYKEPQSGPKNITVKNIEKGLIENDPLKGSQTDRNTQNSNEAQSATFEAIEPENDNQVRKDFEVGELGNDELQEDELTRDETGNGSPGNHKPSSENFNL